MDTELIFGPKQMLGLLVIVVSYFGVLLRFKLTGKHMRHVVLAPVILGGSLGLLILPERLSLIVAFWFLMICSMLAVWMATQHLKERPKVLARTLLLPIVSIPAFYHPGFQLHPIVKQGSVEDLFSYYLYPALPVDVFVCCVVPSILIAGLIVLASLWKNRQNEENKLSLRFRGLRVATILTILFLCNWQLSGWIDPVKCDEDFEFSPERYWYFFLSRPGSSRMFVEHSHFGRCPVIVPMTGACDVTLMKYMVATGADLREKRCWAWPLHVANSYGWIDGVQYITKDGLDEDERRWALLGSYNLYPNVYHDWYSAGDDRQLRLGHPEIIRHLVANGARVDFDYLDITPLAWAAYNGNLPLVKYLVENGAKPTPTNPKHFTGICAAIQTGHVLAARYLLELEPDVVRGRDLGLFWKKDEAACDMVDLLVDYGADVNHKSYENTALFQAVKYGSTELVKRLLHHGADPTIICENGSTALHQACRRNDFSFELCKILIDAGADPTLREESGLWPWWVMKVNSGGGWGTPIEPARQREKVRIMAFLEEAEASWKIAHPEPERKGVFTDLPEEDIEIEEVEPDIEDSEDPRAHRDEGA